MTYREIISALAEYYNSHPLSLAFTGNKIALEPIFPSEVSAGGIYIPDQAQPRCNQGIIKYKGPLCSSDYNIGDYVLFPAYNGDLIQFEDTLTIVMPEDAIHARIVVDTNVDVDMQGPLWMVMNRIASQLKPQ